MRICIVLVGIATLAARPGYAAAQQGPPQDQTSASRPFEAPKTRIAEIKKQLAHLFKKLKLNSEQEIRVKAILAERDREIEMVLENETLSNEAKNARMAIILAESNEEIAEVLDSRQRKQFVELLARLSERQQREREREDEDEPPPPPPDGMPEGGGPPPM